MTPFGAKVRNLRRARGLTLKQMAGALDISQAYLSALEHGHRGLPSPALVVQICEYFGLIWDDFEEMHRLVGLSHPKVTVDTSGLDAARTELANRLAASIGDLAEADVSDLLARLKAAHLSVRRTKTAR
jgi:transcriptional regulator with XRE-family HTH domain